MYQKSNDTIIEVKQELLTKNAKKLDEVSITFTGNKDLFLNQI